MALTRPDPPPADEARRQIDTLTKSFFDVFTNRNGGTPKLGELGHLFVSNGVIVKRSESGVDVMGVAEFIEPRRKLLTDGTLLDFQEQEESAQTFVFAGIASRVCVYRKSGRLRGEYFEGRGLKCLHYVQTPEGWRISSVIWEDERDGLSVPVDFLC